jgi:acyl-CoA reductase-like NAD-dependent aldehyde dehydrogenase
MSELAVGTDKFESHNPATGEVVATLPIHTAEEVQAAVGRAGPAAQWWADTGFAARRRRLKAFKGALARRSNELAELIHAETGKPVDDALIEIMLVLDHIEWASRHAERVLSRHRVRSSPWLAQHRSAVSYHPMGVVGVIGPWNYPLFTPMQSLAYALAAGNAVIFKPSEFTPAVGEWIVEALGEAIPEAPVAQLVTGFGETGAALCRAGVDKLAFTGSADTGRKVMAACAETLTPVLMECGGKDAMIVDDDADLDAAADAAVWGGMWHAGQSCIGVERVYATAPVYDAFLNKVVAKAGTVHAGYEDGAEIGPITMPGQLDVIESHLSDAFERGARALVGGPNAVRAPFVDPVVLVDVPEDAAVMRDETFGPVLPIAKVADAEEALTRTNAGKNLASSVFGQQRAEALAARVKAGMTSVNSVMSYAGMPTLPFGGVGESGFGRTHGEQGLREFTYPKATTVERVRPPVPTLSFDRPDWLMSTLRGVMRLRHGWARPGYGTGSKR